MSAVLDTGVLIDVLRGHRAAVEYLISLPATPVCSQLTRLEVLRAMRSGERSSTMRLLAGVDWHPVDSDVADVAARWGRRYRQSHPGLGVVDLCVAATADVLGLPLATINLRHFPMFPGLGPPY